MPNNKRALEVEEEAVPRQKLEALDYCPGKNGHSNGNSPIVCSWNEWDPLEEIIVGSVGGSVIPPDEPSFRAKVDKEHELMFRAGPRTPESIQKAAAQLDNFIRVLKDHNVLVRRPDEMDYNVPVKTPDWEIACMNCAACPRDYLLPVGHQILESTMSWRSRFFEYRAYRTILKDYFQRDPLFRWTAAPKPQMTDALYDLEYPWREDTEERVKKIKNHEYVTNEFEPIFDAADCTRMGKDILVQHSFVTNRMGFDWLKRHFGTEHRLHLLHFPNDLCPFHMDATFVPIKPPTAERPGVILNSPERKLSYGEDAIFKGAWDIVDAPEPAWEKPPPLSQCSRWLSMNMINVNPDTVCVEASEKPTINYLESLGMKVLQIPFRDVYEFGGSFHCTTADVRRRGVLQSYFPHLDE